MEKLPREIINKIFFFISHPVADIFNLELEVALARFARDIEIDEYCDCCEYAWTEYEFVLWTGLELAVGVCTTVAK